MPETHWTENAERTWNASAHPLWGHVAEDDLGRLLLPSWWNCVDGPWWDRPLDLRRPTHWLPYLRSRLGGRLAFVEVDPHA